MCLCGWVLREQLGEGIKYRDLHASSMDPPIGLSLGYKYGAQGFVRLFPALAIAISFLLATAVDSP
jgi:hypothetical protein